MNAWPESIPSYLRDTPMGQRMLIEIGATAQPAKVMFSSAWLATPLDTGAAIKAKRSELGMTQTDIAEALDCSAANISQIEARETIDRKTDLAFRAIFAAKQANQE